jgi:tripartite-type tricarboxylate transporter receptor subunit TctC
MTLVSRMKRRALLAGSGAALMAGQAGAQTGAQGFPSGRVSLVVPFPPGASTDVTMRIMAERLTQMWGQTVIVDNKGGANGIIAAEAVARAKPDGHTIFATSSMTHAGNPSLYDKLPYDAINDFEPITRMVLVPMVVLVHKGLKVKTLAELTAKLKAEPGKHNYGSGSVSSRVAGELYKMLTGVDATYVGYRNNQLAAPDLNAGTLSFMIIDVPSGIFILNSGWADALAVSQTERIGSLPDVPSAPQAGLPGLLFTTWSAFYAPKGTPRDIVLKLNKDIAAATAHPETAAKLKGIGGDLALTTPEGLMEFTKSEIESWRKVIRAANIKIE